MAIIYPMADTSTFSDYINKKFLEWQLQRNERSTLYEFAKYIGVSQSIISMWMNGQKKPGEASAYLLAKRFGMEVYDVLNLPRPDPDLEQIRAHWVNLPIKAKKAI